MNVECWMVSKRNANAVVARPKSTATNGKNVDDDVDGMSKGFGELIYEPKLTRRAHMHTNTHAHTHSLGSHCFFFSFCSLFFKWKREKSAFDLCEAFAISIHQSMRPQPNRSNISRMCSLPLSFLPSLSFEMMLGHKTTQRRHLVLLLAMTAISVCVWVPSCRIAFINTDIVFSFVNYNLTMCSPVLVIQR